MIMIISNRNNKTSYLPDIYIYINEYSQYSLKNVGFQREEIHLLFLNAHFFPGTLNAQILPTEVLSYVSPNVYLYFILGTLVF